MSERDTGPRGPARRKDGASKPATPPAGSVASRQAFAAWRVERVQKEDGRYLLYYSWPGTEPDPRWREDGDV